MMLEKEIERKLTTAIKKKGGIALKFTSLGFDGMPDRIILLPNGRIAFAELKAPGKKPSALQVARHKMLRKLGFKVFVIDSAEQIGGVIDEIQSS